VSRAAATPADRGRRTWPQRLVLGLNAVLIVTALATAGGLAYVYSRSEEIQRVELGNVLTDEPAAAGEPQNYLIIGTDNALPGEPGYRPELGASERSDTIMLLRVDPGSGQATLLSFPRDLYVRIPEVGRDRINAAIQYGGAERLVATIESNFDIPVHHYVSINLEGFEELVGLVGGIPIYFPEPARDERSGLDVPQAGCVRLDPVQALAYARARAYQTLHEGRWVFDGTGDLGRISRQQHFIRRALDTAIARGARNPLVLRHLVDAGVRSVRLDASLTVDDLVDLGQRFRSFNPDTLTTMSLPVVDDIAGGAEVLRLVESEAQPILDIFRATTSNDQVPGGVSVVVLNGTGVAGAASAAATELGTVGFTVPPEAVGDAEAVGLARTVVRFEPGFEASADLVERHLAGGADLEPVADLDAGPIVVVVGDDWAGVLTTPRPPVAAEPAPAAGASPAPSEQEQPAAATTTLVGAVPAVPPGVEC
jgi:polyisoprenyl-teichoic acid--peptidoglycan teichoic acid transferase